MFLKIIKGKLLHGKGKTSFLQRLFNRSKKLFLLWAIYPYPLEDCPKLHYVPNIEKIIKQFSFPKINPRHAYIRHPNKSLNARMSYSSYNKTNTFKLKIQNAQGDEVEIGEESNLEAIEESEISEMNNEAQQQQQSSKKDVGNSFTSHKTALSTKRLDEPSSHSIVIVSSNNEIKENFMLPKYSETQKTKSFHTTKMTSSEQDSKSKNTGELINSENKGGTEMRINLDIDKVFNFRRYFPTFNIKQIIKNYDNSKKLAQEIEAKFMMKYADLKKYTFYVNPILERFLYESNCRSKQKSNFKLKNSLTMRRKSAWVGGVRSPLQKKNFFEIIEKSKKGINNFTDLLSTLVEKKKPNIYGSIRKSLASGN